MKKKRSSNWDNPGAFGGGEEGDGALGMQQKMAAQQTQQILMQQMMMANNNGGKKTRELYVGNLAIGMVSEQMLREFFNTALVNLSEEAAAGPVVVNVWMASDMKYSFVEFRTAELATTAMSLDKVELCGRSIHVGRPSGYVPPAGPGQADPLAMGMGAMGNVGGMATMMGMSGMGMQGMMEMALAAGAGANATKVLVLENMLSVEELATDEYADIVEDIKEECGSYGTVEDVFVPKPSTDGSTVPGLGKAFVKFADKESAAKACDELAGRTFDGKTVGCNYITEEKFAARDF